jgi:hypothetical protein
MTTWEIVCSIVLAALAIGVVINIHDIMRYIRMRTMELLRRDRVIVLQFHLDRGRY